MITIKKHKDRTICIDNHAIRHGEKPGGWIVIMRHCEVNNRLFTSEASAVRHAMQIHPANEPYVKTLRAE